VSQAGIINIAGGGGGGAPVETLTGNDMVPVPPTGNNINIVGSGGVTVTGNPATSTLTITSGDTFLTGTANTTGNATANIPANIPLPVSNSSVSVRANITGYDVTSNLACALELIGGYRNVAGVLTPLGTPDLTRNNDPALVDCSATLVNPAGTNVQVQVKGTNSNGGADMMKWTAIIDYVIATAAQP
jgi:hypothetical protein